MLSTWRIPAAAAEGWWTTWPEKVSRQPRPGTKPHAVHGFTGDLPETSHHGPGEPSELFPCQVDLRRGTAVDQGWATDINYIPLQKGSLYLVAIMDLFSRHVVSWKLSNSLDMEFCLDSLQMALEGGRKPEIFHFNQGF